MGCNAIRLHHAVAPELLQACDRLGMLVMAENRLFNPAPDYVALLRNMVRRQRNHPSVFLWSLLNEEPLQGTATGYAIMARAASAVRALDDTRPITAAMNDGMFATAARPMWWTCSVSTIASTTTTACMRRVRARRCCPAKTPVRFRRVVRGSPIWTRTLWPKTTAWRRIGAIPIAAPGS